MNRRNFLSLLPLASGLVLPEPRRVYSFPRAPLAYAWLVNYETGFGGAPNIGPIECGLYLQRRAHAEEFAIGKRWDGAASRPQLVDVHEPGLAKALLYGGREYSWLAEYRKQMRRHVIA